MCRSVWPFCRVYSLCLWAVWSSEAFPQGVLSVPVLIQAHAWVQETLRLAAIACQGTNLTAKRGLKAPFVAKFGVHLEKSPMSRVGEGVV